LTLELFKICLYWNSWVELVGSKSHSLQNQQKAIHILNLFVLKIMTWLPTKGNPHPKFVCIENHDLINKRKNPHLKFVCIESYGLNLHPKFVFIENHDFTNQRNPHPKFVCIESYGLIVLLVKALTFVRIFVSIKLI
jgi:hypothetical protein